VEKVTRVVYPGAPENRNEILPAGTIDYAAVKSNS
jgi:hypothetical protein